MEVVNKALEEDPDVAQDEVPDEGKPRVDGEWRGQGRLVLLGGLS